MIIRIVLFKSHLISQNSYFGPFVLYITSLVMVLYMSIRIRSEQLTGQELSDELSNIVPIANAVEMRDEYQEAKPMEPMV